MDLGKIRKRTVEAPPQVAPSFVPAPTPERTSVPEPVPVKVGDN